VKEYLRQLAAQGDNDLIRRCLVREYLQARILESFQDHGVFLRWVFLGGTALRFLYGIPRFSEDLDFSLITSGKEAGFRTALSEVKRALDLWERKWGQACVYAFRRQWAGC
jgi:predicted nucleotidyltransferase component of viral defense system